MMIKKYTLFCLLLALSLQSVTAQQDQSKASYLIVADSFKKLGTWNFETSGTMGLTLIGMADKKVNAVKPALANIKVSKPGKYRLWVHSKDFKEQQGSRFFTLMLNGKELDKKFGTHAKAGFYWADGGTVELKSGINELQMIDKSAFYARCDAILLTNDLDIIPSEDYNSLIAQTNPVNLPTTKSFTAFPNWANKEGAILKKASLENEKVKVDFLQVNDPTNGTFVQNEIYVKDNGEWIKVKDRKDDHGYLMLTAENNIIGSWIDRHMINNIYQKGFSTWLIPTDFKQTANGQINLVFKDLTEAEIGVTWELTTSDPKVTLNAKFKTSGNYSFGLFSGREYSDDEYENALAPFRIMEKRVPKEATLFLEHYLFTPMGSVSLPEKNSIAPGKKLTSAIVVDPTWIPNDYAYRENARFGITMRGPAGGVRSNLFAPLFGSELSTFKTGDSYAISYRVVNELKPWFETYKHIAQDLFQVTVYRSNYYSSLNDAIYNTTDLMMDDERGGWDKIDKAHYNIEERDLTSVANPMTAMQRYLLTENEEILTKRALPTLASLLTRVRLHFKRFDTKGGGNYLSGVAKPTAIGKPINGYNLNVYGGLYEMSRGQMPELLKIGLQNADKVTNLYGNIPPFANDIARYNYTKDEKYLIAAKEKADKYLLDVVYNEKFNSEMPKYNNFINISYFPNLASLLDMYELTKEKRYLDAAVKTGQLLCTSLWVAGIDGEKRTSPLTIDPKTVLERPFMENHDFWWYGSTHWRPGSNKGEGKLPLKAYTKVATETVPGWVPSRVGLGLEQANTFSESLHIYMNTWAGDLMKLSALSGEKYFEVAAKNAIIGRFSTYAGYYQDRYMTHQMKADYPFKGPDVSGLYWHHIPPFLSMLEDFLINQVYAKAQQKIAFPSVRQQGYAYFNSNQYGFAPGKFYDLTEMWLWNDRDIIKPDNVNINYLPAKKDGVFAVALLNEANTPTTTKVKLGSKIKGGEHFSGKATLYDELGLKTEIEVANGLFTVTIPAKGMRSVSINISDVKAPAFSKTTYNVKQVNSKQTVAEHTRGKAYVFQLTPEKYFTYVYLSDLPKDTKQMKLDYTVGGKKSTILVKEYPFEAIVEVDDVSKNFTYELEVVKADGKIEKIKGSEIGPLRK